MFSDSSDIIILALIAGFIAYKLYTLLGRTDDNLRTRENNFSKKIIELATVEEKEIEKHQLDNFAISPNSKDCIKQIKEIDSSFNERSFVEGASKAFEIILIAYCNGDKDTLVKLLDENVYNAFAKDIDQRVQKGHSKEITIVSIEHISIISASLKRKTASITVKYTSQQVEFTKNKEGHVIEGSTAEINKLNDVWTFSKKLNSSDHTWKLTDTQTIEE
jgi:predicted lipid-binding transport protein (Tim44 family)